MPQDFKPIDPRAKVKFDKNLVCENCFRPKAECFCSQVKPLNNRLKVVILQHPQEVTKALNSARLTHLMLKNSQIFVGLSWPSFKKVAGPEEMPSQWGVLFLKPEPKKMIQPLTIYSPKKIPLEQTAFLKGIIALDGSWKQSKALWWRNPWFLKMNRISLNPDHPSLRPQVKSEGLSTIEAIAFALENLGEKAELALALRDSYRNLIIGQPRA